MVLTSTAETIRLIGDGEKGGRGRGGGMEVGGEGDYIPIAVPQSLSMLEREFLSGLVHLIIVCISLRVPCMWLFHRLQCNVAGLTTT